MSKKQSEVPQPPEPPQVGRGIKLYPYQWVGLPVILLIPLLALFGVFGDRFTQATQLGNGLEIQVNYAANFRYKTINPLEITVRNTSTQTVDRLVVSVDRNYIENFTEVEFKPDIAELTEESYEIEFENVPAGESRVVTVDLQGERPGQHTGTITASAGDTNTVQTSIQTFVFP